MSRQIDNMTPQEIETLHLKGMLATNKAHHMTNDEIDSTYQRIDANKAQPWHSVYARMEALENELVQAAIDEQKLKAHADKLAEALREILAMNHGLDGTPEVETAQTALTAYEAAQ